MIVAIRIKGIPSVSRDAKKTMHLLRLRKKYSCVLIHENPITGGMIEKVAKHIAYGEISRDAAKELILKRGMLQGNKLIQIDDSKLNTFVDNLFANKAKLEDIKLKPFFRLHPPRGGFKKSTRLMFPQGILGNQGEKINELLRRML